MNSINQEAIKNILKKVRQIEIKTKRLVTDAMSGAYHSVFKGQGMDFEAIREYVLGDDIRRIDWNVTAKTGKPFVKTFREERELTIMLMVDVSASGSFGSINESKREIAAELASVLAFAATRNKDKVGLILFTETIEKFIPPKKSRQHILRLIREILFYEPTYKKTDINKALDYFNRVVKRQSIAFLISDFLEDAKGCLPEPKLNTAFEAQDPLIKNLEITNKHHDLICVNLVDPREMCLPKVGIISLENAESNRTVQLDTFDPQVRKRYAQLNAQRLDVLKRVLAQKNIGYLKISTDKPYIQALHTFLNNRMKRK